MGKRALFWGVCLAMVWTASAHAQSQVDIGTTFGEIQNAANAWIPTMVREASFLFYALASLDFAWSAPSFLREGDFMGLFLSLIKKLLVISFFYAVLINGQVWIPAIVNSFAELGANSAGVSLVQNPSDIMAQGINLVAKLFAQISAVNLVTQPLGALTTVLAACIILLSYVIITLHYVVTKLEAVIVMSAGYIFLGFGGSRWTAPYFERYVSLAVSTGVRLMLIYLMLGVYTTISGNWVAAMNGYSGAQPITQIFPTLMSMLLFAFASWMIPKMAGSIASGTLGTGAADLVGIGAEIGKGAALGAATVAAAVATGGAGAVVEGAMAATETAGMAAEAGVSSSVSGSAASGAAATADSAGASGGSVPAPPLTSVDGGEAAVSAPPAPPARAESGGGSSSSSSGTPAGNKADIQIPDDGSGHVSSPRIQIEREE
ncbi:Conjugative transfer protein TrbL (plasmid) [Acidisarcina polymorpha]|uniref:Conjugative transfer protein TrbL n=1 Tax=Acidisarcina polymorpha TaxID=2211140 RepID=A0A2Z5GCA5_9BACT|nr:P-type conjugative transfer protein TrbL [Acidisarcina polymorpha]AXC16437.1 Conjugative transfer protein TrbL [Acidisarcina polymorpha]